MGVKKHTLREISLHLCGTDKGGGLVLSTESVSRHLKAAGVNLKDSTIEEKRHAIFKRLTEQSIRGLPDDKNLDEEGFSLSDKQIIANTRLSNARAESEELKVQVKKGNLAPIYALQLAVTKIGSSAAGKLASIPLNLKRRLAKLTVSDLEIISREIIAVQNAISEIKITDEDISEAIIVEDL